ncbi:MAG: FlgD immunoglobulin-like domain containing protein [Bacteroidota bacterium]
MRKAGIVKAALGMAAAVFLLGGSARSDVPAFPGAEGFGRHASGGRGGRVHGVTNLNDAGPGSLREAVLASGPRTVVFRVSGTIRLLSALRIRNGDITIAGQTAPGEGVCLRDYPVKVEASNVIVRYLRFRLGDSTRLAEDAFSGNGSVSQMRRHIILDHCSVGWAIDECSSFYDNGDFTMQWCFITESLYHSYHPSGNHGYGGMWGGWRASFHHNLLAHHSSRNPRFNGSRYTGLPDSEQVDFRNNVIYNWGFNSAYGGERGNQNMVANYFKYGPGTNTSVRGRIVEPSDTLGNWHVSGNHVFGYPAITADNWNGGVQGTWAQIQKNRRRLLPFPYDSVTTHTPETAFELVLAHGGAVFPARDTLDARIVQEVRTGTAGGSGLWGALKGIIDTQDTVGGWPHLASLPPPPDADADGMPDDWELAHGLNPADSSDGPAIAPDGYSYLEHYLNSLPPGIPTGAREGAEAPRAFRLRGSYPNPFNPAATLRYNLERAGHVAVLVMDTAGRVVRRVREGREEAGEHETAWTGTDDRMQRVASGVYFWVVRFEGRQAVQKMVLMK